jgi:hypothetical protein
MEKLKTKKLDNTPLEVTAKTLPETILVAPKISAFIKDEKFMNTLFLPQPFSLFYSLVNMQSLSGTLPRQHPVVSMSGLSLIPQPSYIGGPSMMGHPTLRRQSSHDMDQNMPRILSRNAANVQYYYG